LRRGHFFSNRLLQLLLRLMLAETKPTGSGK